MEKMKYIIMCGGTYLLWEKPRHLVEIGGVPVVARTIELLRENGIDDIAISSDNDIFGQFGYTILRFRPIVLPDILYHSLIPTQYVGVIKVQYVHLCQRSVPDNPAHLSDTPYLHTVSLSV